LGGLAHLREGNRKPAKNLLPMSRSKRPRKLHADKGYDSGGCPAALRKRGVVPRIAHFPRCPTPMEAPACPCCPPRPAILLL
jgi:IS5 family transposase